MLKKVWQEHLQMTLKYCNASAAWGYLAGEWVIHEKNFIADLCAKGCPWATQGQKQKI